jgi:hypothetical protein
MMLKPGKETVLVISDTQNPFQHPDALAFLSWVASKYAISKVVHLGDEVDFHGISKYFKDPDGMSAGDEMKAAIKSLRPFYREFPDTMVCTSNHVDRPYIRAFEAGLPRSFIKDINDVLDAPCGWVWKDKWIIDEIAYVHGHHLPGGTHAIQQAAKNYGRSVVFGHVHAHAGVYYIANDETLRFAFNAGCLIDHKAYAFTYGNKYINKPIISCGVVDRGIPILIPMLLDSSGRWLKKATSELLKVKEDTIICKHEKTHHRGSYIRKNGEEVKVSRCASCSKTIH